MSGSSYSSGPSPSRRSQFRARGGSDERKPDPSAGPVDPEEIALPAEEPLPEPLPGSSPSDVLEALSSPEPAAAPNVQGNQQPPPFAVAVRRPGPPARRPWIVPVVAGLLLAVGGSALYHVGHARGAAAARQANAAGQEQPALREPTALSAEENAQLDAAYRAGKEQRYAEANKLFAAIARKHPEWDGVQLDIARYDIYARTNLEAQKILLEVQKRPAVNHRADAYYLYAFLSVRLKDFPSAEMFAAKAAAVDPTRSEYYYLWGDCLELEGKVREAGQRFRSALWRNQFETAEELLQLKAWLCDIAAEEEAANGTGAAIDAALATPHPRPAALLAAAARALKAGSVPAAAALLERGRNAMDPAVFMVARLDPTFRQESWRPELAPFYAPAPAQK